MLHRIPLRLLVFLAMNFTSVMLILLLVLLLMSVQLQGAFGQLETLGQQDVAFELDADNFNESLWAAPGVWAMVDFYANWCPACRNYKPHYERVARLFNGLNAVHPRIVYMAKVDCALKINARELCERFHINHYPTLLWGTTLNFANSEKELETVENARTDITLLQWINQKLGESFMLDDVAPSEDGLSEESSFDSAQVAISVYDIEEATAKTMEILLGGKLLNQTSRPSFISFLQLMVVYHPSKRCRKGAGEILINMEEIWPSLPAQDYGSPHATLPDYEALELFNICGDGVPRGYWMFCRGSLNDTRGYSCGIWLLFHSLSVRAEDNLAYGTLQIICTFVRDFFKCKECNEHFTKMCMSTKGKIASRYDLVLWLWHAHNEVNKRVGKVEAAVGTGDPKFPKISWPSRRLCKSCRPEDDNSTGLEFHEPEVYLFLLKFYGRIFSKSSNGSDIRRASNLMQQADSARHLPPENSSSSAVAVPIGAAICIAFASCGFGAVACYWRIQQKKRKQMWRRN